MGIKKKVFSHQNRWLCHWTSLVVQCIRICLPRQGTRAQSLIQEDSTCYKQLSHHAIAPKAVL